ncbi:MAG: MBOAT family protein, partial [Chitinophagaceae bacterium]
KYTVFGLENLNALLSAVSAPFGPVTIPHIALPLGVSFIVFEKITYLVDIHRGIAHPAKSVTNYLNYVFLFPKLLAGPIVKYHDIEGQLERPAFRYDDFRIGMIRFLIGLGKKMLIADALSPVADAVFSSDPSGLQASTAWIGLACFTLQIYFDFSGYSDMAIGIGRIMGFRLLENFNNPYLATSFTDFWRRWHISLSSWIKEYLYIPLGGNRVPTWRIYLNLTICFMLSGFWHGASWNFVIWGALHGVMLVADRAFLLKFSSRLPYGVNVIGTLLLVMVTWVFFRCPTFPHATGFLGAMFGGSRAGFNGIVLHRDALVVMVIGTLVVIRPVLPVLGRCGFRDGLATLSWCLLLLALCMGHLAVNSFNPFLYFRF